MRRLTVLPTLCVLLCAGLPAHAAAATPPETTWMSVLLDGRKIGSLEIERQLSGQTVITTQTLSMTLDRIGKPMQLGSMVQTIESSDGTPLGFSSRRSLSSMDSTVEGRRIGKNQFEVTTTIGGDSHLSELQLPTGVLMFDAQRRAMKAASAHPGKHYTLLQFDPGSLQTMQVSITVMGDETRALPDGSQILSHQRQQLLLTNGIQTEYLWLDHDGNVRAGQTQLLGQPLEMIACSKQCALAPDQGLDMFRTATVDSPQLLPVNVRAAPLTYFVHIIDGDDQSPFIDTDEQRVRQLGHGNWIIDIGHAYAGGQPPPTAQDTAPTEWLQSDAPAMRALAAKAVGKAKTPLQKIRRLRHFVSGYITEHDLDVGYASALEVLKNRSGDCTEYAVLLAALARAEDIPTRVVTGLVYAERAGGSLRVYVPHAWVQAWINGRWQSYDAALRHFDAGHIALASGNGNPSSFFRSTRLFGRLKIDRVISRDDWIVAPTMSTSPPSASADAAGK